MRGVSIRAKFQEIEKEVSNVKNPDFMSRVGEIFGDRLSLGGGGVEGRIGASVFPTGAGEVADLAALAGQYSVALLPLGAGTEHRGTAPAGESPLSVRFDLMRSLSLSEDSLEVEAEPGAAWISVQDLLRDSGLGLRVYPTSAPRATVGGWVSLDGVGIGSFEFGWLSENVAWTEVVLPGGERRVVEARAEEGIVVRAGLQLREAERDVPFAAAFDDAESLSRAAGRLHAEGVPLWHLGLSNPAMSFSSGARNAYLLSGAYPADRARRVKGALEGIVSGSGGESLPTLTAFRVWGERFFPAKPSGRTPHPGKALVPLAGLSKALGGLENLGLAVSGSVARAGEVLLLGFLPGAERGRPGNPGELNREKMLDIVRSAGGREYGPPETPDTDRETSETRSEPASRRTGRWKRVLLATDGSAGAQEAARTAAEVAAEHGSELHLVHVLRDAPSARLLDSARSELERQGREVLDAQARSVEEAGASVAGTHLRRGSPAEEILAVRDEVGADLVILGSRGLGPVRRAVLGSVSERVLHRAGVPVLVVGAESGSLRD